MARRKIGEFFKAMKERNRRRKELNFELKRHKKTIKTIKGLIKEVEEKRKRVSSSPNLDDLQKDKLYEQIEKEKDSLSRSLRNNNLQIKEIKKKKGLL